MKPDNAANASARGVSPDGAAGRSVALLLAAGGLLLAAWIGFGTAGYAPERGPLLNLAEARVGLYLPDDAAKRVRGGYVTASGEFVRSVPASEAIPALLAGALTVQQRGTCVRLNFSRHCNVPFVQLTLGVALGMAVLALGGALALVLGGSLARLRLGLLLFVGGVALGLLSLGSANGIFESRPSDWNLRHARVGFYRTFVDIADPKYLGVPLRELERLEKRGGPLTVEQPDSCFLRRWPLLPACNRALLEVPLLVPLGVAVAAVLAGLFSLAVAAGGRRAG